MKNKLIKMKKRNTKQMTEKKKSFCLLIITSYVIFASYLIYWLENISFNILLLLIYNILVYFWDYELSSHYMIDICCWYGISSIIHEIYW